MRCLIFQEESFRRSLHLVWLQEVRITNHNECADPFLDTLQIDVGYGDISYNTKRNLAALIPVSGEISFHLVEIAESLNDTPVSLLRKAKWNPQRPSDSNTLHF